MYFLPILVFSLISLANTAPYPTGATTEKCGPEFSKIYDNCKRLRLKLGTDFESNPSVSQFLDYLSDSVIVKVQVIIVEYSTQLPVETAGQFNDAFLQPRPQWSVYHEEYSWQKHRTNHVVYILNHILSETLQQMANILYPSDCKSRPILFKGYHDFDEYGNEHINIGGYSSSFMGAITLVHIREYAKFIDDGYCPNEINKYNCAFLPMTNCPLPSLYLNCEDFAEDCTPGNLAYEGGFPEAKLISRNYDSGIRIDRPPIHEISIVGDVFLSRSLFDFAHVDVIKVPFDGLGSLFYNAIFLRRNFDFRSRAAKLVHNFYHHTHKPYGPNDNCIAIHIRHHDRIKPGFDMIKYCNEFVRRPDGTCYNSTDRSPIEPDCTNYWDFAYACASAVPFGGISFESYLKAAEVLMDKPPAGSSVTKNVFIVTDDGDWVAQERVPFDKEWNIHVMPAQPRHRERATINGATVFASMELVQQCSGLVGHSVSAFTRLLRAIMCVRHGPKNRIRFGKCPKYYDFASLSGQH